MALRARLAAGLPFSCRTQSYAGQQVEKYTGRREFVLTAEKAPLLIHSPPSYSSILHRLRLVAPARVACESCHAPKAPLRRYARVGTIGRLVNPNHLPPETRPPPPVRGLWLCVPALRQVCLASGLGHDSRVWRTDCMLTHLSGGACCLRLGSPRESLPLRASVNRGMVSILIAAKHARA